MGTQIVSDLRDSDFDKILKCLLESVSQQEVDAGRLHLVPIDRLSGILEKFGLRLCRDAARSAESWRYLRRRSERLGEHFTFTVGELYVLLQIAKQVQAAHQIRSIWRKATKIMAPKMKPKVFLGGTCSATTWRQEVAVPFCRANDFSYFDPQVPARCWTPALIHVEERAKIESSAFVFYVSSAARSLTSMIEMVYLISQRKNLIAVVSRKPVRLRRRRKHNPPANDLTEPRSDGAVDGAEGSNVSASPSGSTRSSQIDAEDAETDTDDLSETGDEDLDTDRDHEVDEVTAAEQRELARAREALVQLAERNGYPAFETLRSALISCAPLIRDRAEVGQLIGKHAVLPLELVAMRYRDSLRQLHVAFRASLAADCVDDRITFAQAYTILQEVCAEHHISCVRLPQCSSRALLTLLNAAVATPSPTPSSTPALSKQLSRASDSDSNHLNISRRFDESGCFDFRTSPDGNDVNQMAVAASPDLNQLALRAIEKRKGPSGKPAAVFRKLMDFIGRRGEPSVRVTVAENLREADDDDGEEIRRRVSFDECCFLFGWLLEREFYRCENERAAVEGLTDFAGRCRSFFSTLLHNVKHVQTPSSSPHKSKTVAAAEPCLPICDEAIPASTVHLRGATGDSTLFDDLLVPLLIREVIPFYLGVDGDYSLAVTPRLQERSACERRRSRSASPERLLPDLVRMTRLSRSVCTIDAAIDGDGDVDAAKRLSIHANPEARRIQCPPTSIRNASSLQTGRLESYARSSQSAKRLRYRCAFANARLLVFAFTRSSKSIVEMLQCAQCIGEDPSSHCRILLYVEMFESGDAPDGELLNKAALKDYNRVRMYLLSMAKAHERDLVRIASSRSELVELLSAELGLQGCQLAVTASSSTR